MRLRATLLAGLSLIALASPVQAADVSASGAEAMQQALTRYLPKDLVDAGLVTVRAATSFYELRLDPSALFADADPQSVSISGLKPFVHYVRPLDGGLYSVESSENLDIRGTFNGGAEVTSFTYLIDTMKMTGVYDPEISYFRNGEFTARSARVTTETPTQSVEASFGEMAMTVAAVKADDQTLDLTSTGFLKAFAETIVGKESGRVEIAADTVDIDVRMDGARYKALQDIVFFVLDNADKQSLPPAEAGRLKEMLRAVLPVFTDLQETIAASNVNVVTPQGAFSIDKVGYRIGMNGIAPSTRVSFGFSADGPRPPAGIMPDAFLPAVPTTARFDMAITDLNLEGAVHYLLDNADFTGQTQLTEAQNKELGRIVLPGGAMNIAFDAVEAKSEIYDVRLNGRMTVYPEEKGRQSVEVTIIARDFDKTVAFLQKNAGIVPQFGQAAFVLLMVKGFGKDQGDGSQRWDVAVNEAGKVLINGNPLPFQP